MGYQIWRRGLEKKEKEISSLDELEDEIYRELNNL